MLIVLCWEIITSASSSLTALSLIQRECFLLVLSLAVRHKRYRSFAKRKTFRLYLLERQNAALRTIRVNNRQARAKRYKTDLSNRNASPSCRKFKNGTPIALNHPWTVQYRILAEGQHFGLKGIMHSQVRLQKLCRVALVDSDKLLQMPGMSCNFHLQ